MNFESLQLALARWPAEVFEVAIDGDPLLRRLQQVLKAKATAIRSSDFLPLLRHVLSREAARRGRAVALRVPCNSNWPPPTTYASHGLRVLREDTTSVIVESASWRPPWLDHEGEEDLFADTFAERVSRRLYARPVDPAIAAATGFTEYTSPGQRAAVHAVLLAPPRSTMVVTLPTGSGKSLVAQAPSLLAGEGACTIVVVPTISLAIDQERQFAALWRVAHPTAPDLKCAWHAGVPESTKQQIKQALRSGRQPILFTSPESVVGSLRLAIYDASRSGYLRYFVIDEAHLVAQWGDSFRPEFQSLAAFRRALNDAAPGEGFKTVLMTATLTEDALRTIETLFTDGAPAALIASVHLRTEPRYWFAHAEDDEDQRTKVLEVLRHAPRPLILYATRIDKARRWATLLRNEGHERVGLFHGETGPKDRQTLIDAWAADELDVMVATSAFGVGIDKRNVRCIVHACVPESLDRYYQEVGRSGRDGKASTAIAIFTDEDVDTARGIAAPALITAELGLPRWREMISKSTPAPGNAGVWRIDLATVPQKLHRATDYNRAWNLRTVMLLARAEVISLAAEPPASVGRDENTAELDDEEVRRIFDTVLVRILEPDHLDPNLWATHIERSRTDTLESAWSGLKRMERVLRGSAEISRELQELYTINSAGRRVLVTAACSGCPKCRALGLGEARPVSRPLVRPLDWCEVAEIANWRNRFEALSHPPVLIIFDPNDPNLTRHLDQLALQLRGYGMRELHIKRSDFPDLERLQVLREISAQTFVALTELGDHQDELTPVPRLTIFRIFHAEAFARLEREPERPFDWIVVPQDAVDPLRPDRRLADVRNSIWLTTLIEDLRA